MKEIEKRIQTLERSTHGAKVAGVLMQYGGEWRLSVNGKNRFFDTEEAARSAFYRMTSPDSPLIIW
jgi:hypothetical protein